MKNKLKDKDLENALLDCFDLWVWQAGNIKEGYWRWPGWEKNGGWASAAMNSCPLCEYVFKTAKFNEGCKMCPVDWEPAVKCTDNNSILDVIDFTEGEEKELATLEVAIKALDRLFWEWDNEV